eukprot:4069483-Alexandrium_andersonii.AAC.1
MPSAGAGPPPCTGAGAASPQNRLQLLGFRAAPHRPRLAPPAARSLSSAHASMLLPPVPPQTRPQLV